VISPEVILQVLASGIVLGGIYAIASLGLGLSWGILHVINFAHGEWILISMYASYWLVILLGVDPLILIPINILLGALIGMLTQRLLVETTKKGGALASILSTFGLSLTIIGSSQLLWKSYARTMPNRYINMVVKMGVVRVSGAHFVSFLVSVGVIMAIYIFFKRTLIGKAILASSEIFGDPEVALLMGVDVRRIRLITMALAGISTGVAGNLIATFYYIHPYIGTLWCILAFVVVVLAGLGSLKGIIIAGILVGILESVGSLLIGTAYSYILVFLAFILTLYIRPRGLMGRR